MLTRIFPLKNLFPARCDKPVSAIPVFFENKTVTTVSLDDTGNFRIVLPPWLEREIMRKRNVSFVPNIENLNRNLDPLKIRMRITGLKLTVATPSFKTRSRRTAKLQTMLR